MKHLKSFESIYSLAARVAPKEFTKPVNNNEYVVKRILIKFPDTTELMFDVVSESVYSDTINYRIKVPSGDIRDYRLFPGHTLQSHYLKFFGELIQMSDYEEFVFVRCWNNPQDFIENDWEGYIFREDKDGFYEIQMKFNIDTPYDLMDRPTQPTWTPIHFKNQYFDKNTTGVIINKVIQELPNGISYKDLMGIKKKFESYLLNLDESSPINLALTKIDNISLLSIIYCLFLRDNNILKNFKLDTLRISNCPVSNLLDTIFLD